MIRVPYDRTRPQRQRETSGGRKSRSVAVRLIDSNENQFVLARTKDSTMPQDDEHLIQV